MKNGPIFNCDIFPYPLLVRYLCKKNYLKDSRFFGHNYGDKNIEGAMDTQPISVFDALVGSFNKKV